MQEITIKNFKGVNLDEGNWQDAYAGYVAGLDIWGLGKSSSKISYPGIPQGIFDVSAGAQAASPSAVTGLVLDFTRFLSQDFAIGAAATARIYRRDSNTWTWVSAGAAAITVSGGNTPAAALKVYGANMYYATAGFLGVYDNTTGDANFQSLLDTTLSQRKMAILNGNLYGLDNRYVWKYDGATFTNNSLTLPAHFVARDVEVYGDLMYIMADNGEFSTLFIWDGLAATYKTALNIYEEQNAPSLKLASGLLWLVANRGASTTGTPIYYTNGAEITKVQILPIKRSATVGLAEYAGGLAIGSNEGATAAYEDGLAGVWVLNRNSSNYPYSAALAFPLRDQFTNKTLGAINFFGQTGYIAANDVTNATFEIFELQGSQANATNIWQTLPIDAGATSEKMWHYIKLNFENLITGQTIVVKYRLDDASAFTTLKTFSTTGAAAQNKQYIPILRSSRTITIRVELTASASETTRLHSFTLGFTATKK